LQQLSIFDEYTIYKIEEPNSPTAKPLVEATKSQTLQRRSRWCRPRRTKPSNAKRLS